MAYARTYCIMCCLQLYTQYMLVYFIEMGKNLCDQEYHTAVDTNNGAEAFHKITIMYSYLPKQHSINLSSIAKFWLKIFYQKVTEFICSRTTSNPVNTKVTKKWCHHI